MDAVKFIEERNRMCRSFGDRCTGCPALNVCENELGCTVGQESTLDATAQIVMIEAWSAAHPRKTRQSVFLTMFPHVRLNDKGQPWFCPRELDTAYHPVDGCILDVDICQRCKDKFWGQEVE